MSQKINLSPEHSIDISKLQEFTREYKKIKGEEENAFELRFKDTQSSAKTTSLEKSETPSKEEQVSWSRKIINTVYDFFGGLFGSKKVESTPSNEDSPVEPLGQRPHLPPPDSVRSSHLKKLIHDMNTALARMQDATGEAEEIIMHKDADVAMMWIIKKSSLLQNDLAREELAERTRFQTELQERSKSSIDEINRVQKELNDKIKISEGLGWVNAGLTAVILGGTAIIVVSTFATLGIGAPALAAIGVITAGAGIFEGGATIAKGAIDYQAQGYKATIDTIATNRQLAGGRGDTNLNGIEKTISAIHQNNTMIIEALAMIRDTIRYAHQE